MSDCTFNSGFAQGAYVEKKAPRLSRLDEWGVRLWGNLERRRQGRSSRWAELPGLLRDCDTQLAILDDAALLAQAQRAGAGLRAHGLQAQQIAEVFAVVREVAGRAINQRHYDVQIVGGAALLHGTVAEMQTGEGKTLTATLPAAAAALAGSPVHVITVNDYLAERDAELMRPVYEMLGLTVGVVIGGMEAAERRAAYGCDITYCTNSEVAFDYLKDRIVLGRRRGRLRLHLEQLGTENSRRDNLIHRGLHFAIVDEADSVLIDEARTPLIISQQVHDAEEESYYPLALQLGDALQEGEHFKIRAAERSLELTTAGRSYLAKAAGESAGCVFRNSRHREELVRQALSARHLFIRDRDYLVRDEKIQIIDEFTGRLMPDRSWERGLHQLIGIKEGVEPAGHMEPLAKISYQRFFSRYHRLAGMTGTAREVRAELWDIYQLPVVTIPTRRPMQRRMLGKRVLATMDEKWRVVAARVAELTATGQPVLIGTRSVEASEQIALELDKAGLIYQVLNARQDEEEAETIAAAGQLGAITVATNMAGRGTDIHLGEGVAELGGLHVLATEYHEARRIDRQLFGRAGRQGDPGSYEAVLSREDELIRKHGGMMTRWLTQHRSGDSAAVTAAQFAAERLHARMRRDLFRADKQRETMLAFSGEGE